MAPMLLATGFWKGTANSTWFVSSSLGLHPLADMSELEDTQLQAADRLDRLLLIMALALHWCVRIGQEDVRDHSTPLEKKRKRKLIPRIGPLENSPAAPFPGSPAVCGCWKGDFRWNSPYLPSTRSARDEELIGGKHLPQNS